MKSEEIHVGGQAVIEGVMMRAPERVSVAVRTPDGKITVKEDPYSAFSKKHKFFGLPLLRGAVVLIESLVLGVKALSWSAEVAMDEEDKKNGKKKEEKKGNLSKLSLVFTVIFALVAGLLIFFYIPLVLTDLIGVKSGVAFNLVDGVIRLLIFGLYIFLISLWKEIRRVFEYHGAEHKSIYAFESGVDLTVDKVREYSTKHPRCGTSFLIVVMIVSILVFIGLGRPDTIQERLIRLLFVPLIGGISYEFIKLSGKKRDSKIAKIFIAPGVWLQKVTTKEPDDQQLEVALVALKSALGNDLSEMENVVFASHDNKDNDLK